MKPLVEKTAKIGKNVVLEDDVVVSAGSVIGYDHISKPRGKIQTTTVIGRGTFIGNNSVIYRGVVVGEYSKIHHGVIMRENMVIGDRTNIGHYCVLEGYGSIGNECSIWGQSHITAFSIIEDKVFTAPFLMTTNDPVMDYLRLQISKGHKGATIRHGARIGAAVTLLPGIEIGEEAVIAAGSLVTKNVPMRTIVMGRPAKVVGSVPESEWL